VQVIGKNIDNISISMYYWAVEKKPKGNVKPLTLKPLRFDQAVRGLLDTPPLPMPPKAKGKRRQRK